MRRIIPLSIALALAGTTLVAGSSSTASSNQAAAPAGVERTQFFMLASSYGSRVFSSPLPVESGQTSLQSISCTNKAGLNRRNFIPEVKLGDFGTASGVLSRVWTEKVGKKVASNATHDIANITLSDADFGSLKIKGLESFASAFHDAKGFHAITKTNVASIVYTDPEGESQGIEIPSNGEAITIPGLLQIQFGGNQRKVTRKGALAVTQSLDIKMFPGTENQVRTILARTKAQIGNGIKSGIFGGNAVGAQAKVLGDLVNVGKVPLQYMPCPGTGGEVLLNETAALNLGPLVDISGLAAAAQGSQTRRSAKGTTAAHVASVNLGDGELVITGIRGVATVTRANGKVKRSTEGTRVVEIVNGEGEPQEILGDGLEIPGLAKLESKIVKNTKNGVKVVALRITLLDGSGAVIDLGTATVNIKPSARPR